MVWFDEVVSGVAYFWKKFGMHFQTAVSRGENETKAKSLANHQSCQPHAMLTPKLLKGPSFLWLLDNNMMDNFPDDARHTISENSRALKTSLLFFRGNSIFRVVHTSNQLGYVFYINMQKILKVDFSNCEVNDKYRKIIF